MRGLSMVAIGTLLVSCSYNYKKQHDLSDNCNRHSPINSEHSVLSNDNLNSLLSRNTTQCGFDFASTFHTFPDWSSMKFHYIHGINDQLSHYSPTEGKQVNFSSLIAICHGIKVLSSQHIHHYPFLKLEPLLSSIIIIAIRANLPFPSPSTWPQPPFQSCLTLNPWSSCHRPTHSLHHYQGKRTLPPQ